MRGSLRRLVAAFFLAGALTILSTQTTASQRTGTMRFDIEAVVKLDAEEGGEKAVIEGTVGFQYSLVRQDKTFTVTLHEVRMVASANKQVLKTELNRTRMRLTKDGKTEEITAEKADDATRKRMEAMFDTPLFKLELKPNGTERQATLVNDAPSVANFVKTSGFVELTTFFHPVLQDKETWEIDAKIAVEERKIAVGKMRYTKAKMVGNKQTAYKLSGTLVLTEGGVDVGKYAVTGEQVYDSDVQEWISGDLSMDMDVQVEGFKSKGTQKITLKRVEGK